MTRPRVELEGLPPPGMPDGRIIVARHGDDRLRIDHADPRVLISAELLDSIVDDPAPYAWVDLAGCTTYDGALLRILGTNRSLVYRIVEYVPQIRGYIMEWPD